MIVIYILLGLTVFNFLLLKISCNKVTKASDINLTHSNEDSKTMKGTTKQSDSSQLAPTGS